MLLGEAELEPWMSAGWKADRDWDITSAAGDTRAQLLAQFAVSRPRSDIVLRALAASTDSLGTLSKTSDRHTGEPFSVRWVMVHLIEEYARHLGHADLIRESIDGETGD